MEWRLYVSVTADLQLLTIFAHQVAQFDIDEASHATPHDCIARRWVVRAGVHQYAQSLTEPYIFECKSRKLLIEPCRGLAARLPSRLPPADRGATCTRKRAPMLDASKKGAAEAAP